MDSDGLPIVGPGIDFTKVGAIHQKRTLAFLNHFVVHTARFLNRFSCVCEEKLETLTVRLQRLETTMNILEAKLTSIPGLENVTVPASNATATTPSTTTGTTPSAVDSQTQQAAHTPATGESEAPAPEPEPVQEKPQMTVSQDPRYIKYFKMIQVGVPAGALRQKMVVDGLDPDLIDKPDAPVPDGGGIQQTQDDSDSDFSEDAKDEESDSSGFSD